MIQQGLKENLSQFWLLILVNAFVGAMVGLERSVIPQFASQVFNINAGFAVFSFIIAFGLSKSIANLVMGYLTLKLSRKSILMLGWLFALPVPIILIYAPSWNWIIFANVLLGLNQGLAWSSTVVMKIDLVGEKNRGLAMGLNEFSGYLAVGLAGALTGYTLSTFSNWTYVFFPGILFAVMGLLVTLFFVKNTEKLVDLENVTNNVNPLKNIWKETTFKHRNLGAVTLSGFTNNLNDGVLWSILPILLLTKNFSITEISILAGIYPTAWGIGQLFTGKMGDVFCKKQLISLGMMLQALAIFLLIFNQSFIYHAVILVVLGLGTALVYPNFITVIAENSNPKQRPQILSIFRFWRDMGYVAGAVLAGLTYTYLGLNYTLITVAGITLLAGIYSEFRMCCTKKVLWKTVSCFE
ncbi:MFS transporter [Pedobacter cryophilus]|uniref:MFS transporter n=1 Tax=Pedobacter cryophilus TaxID=2571271 RepID=A0A4U1BY26_9SPHI|nr:MFS transporter [Pedobacter cryophilus]TKB97665.1 MFS transporter [Pedobacter cryophilus]